MAQQTINIGAVANDGTGDPLRDAFDKANDNFTELYAGLTGLLDFKGSTDCSANPNYPAASKADFYLVSVAGKIGGASGIDVEAGDSFFATADNAGGTQASVGTSWTVVQGNITSYMPKTGGVFTGDIEVPADVYDATSWNGNNEAPTKNDVRDKIEGIIAGVPSAYTDEMARDAVMAMIVQGGLLTETENDAGDTDTLTVPASSTTDVLTGTSATSAVTPDALAALWEKGADVASAGTVSLGEGGSFHITGTTTITDIDPATDKAGRFFVLTFDGSLTLTHNASTLILPTGANIQTAAGDTAIFVSEGSDVVRCVGYQRASGQALAAGTVTQYYRIGFFFTTTPAVSEVIALHVASDAFTLPANFATPDSKGSCGTNPTASFALDVQKNGSSIGTITISTGGAFTFATASGTSKSIAAGDVIKIVAPSPVDATCASVAVTLKGTI